MIIKPVLKSLSLAGIIVVGAVIAGYFIYCATILLWSKSQGTLKPHDALIVLTGAKGRIQTGFELLLKDKAPKMLITGVGKRTSYNDLIKENTLTLSDKDAKTISRHCCITLDYVADTTETNAIEAAKWINDNNVHSLILVTSASHMPRAYLQFDKVIDRKIIITPFPYRDRSAFELVGDYKFWQYAAREYIKFVGSIVRFGREYQQ